MRLAAIVVQNLIRLIGVCLLILGFMFWARSGYQYVPIHVGLGIALVVLLWVLSVLGFVARVKPGLVLAGLLWGLLVLWLGMAMRSGRLTTVFPGHSYEAARVLHFLVGLGAIGVAES